MASHRRDMHHWPRIFDAHGLVKRKPHQSAQVHLRGASIPLAPLSSSKAWPKTFPRMSTNSLPFAFFTRFVARTQLRALPPDFRRDRVAIVSWFMTHCRMLTIMNLDSHRQSSSKTNQWSNTGRISLHMRSRTAPRASTPTACYSSHRAIPFLARSASLSEEICLTCQI